MVVLNSVFRRSAFLLLCFAFVVSGCTEIKSKDQVKSKDRVVQNNPNVVPEYNDSGGQPLGRDQLQIGKTVPEIEGEDVDGIVFRLSDYRGKVVVIDFWGDW